MRRKIGSWVRRGKMRRTLQIRNPARLLICILALLLAGLGVVLILLFQKPTVPVSSASSPSGVLEAQQTATATPQESAPTVQPETEPTPSAPVPVLEDVGGYPVIAKLVIESLSLDLPVIGEVSDAALKVSPCLYMGPSSPAYPGNIVIVGHNNRNKTHFGHLNELKAGSTVLLSDKYGTEYRYEVYDTETIGPNEVDALEIYEGEYGLALVTCADQGKNRLLVRCRRGE